MSNFTMLPEVLRYKINANSQVERCLFFKLSENNKQNVIVGNVPSFLKDSLFSLLKELVPDEKLESVTTIQGHGFMEAHFSTDFWAEKFLNNVRQCDVLNLDYFGIDIGSMGLESKF